MTTFIGTAGNDFQETGWNDLYGNAGNDHLASDQPGAEHIYGGSGSDFLYAANPAGTARIEGGDDKDTIVGYLLDDDLIGGKGDDVISGGGAHYPAVSGGQITPSGPSGNDHLAGGGGMDALYGFDGDDVIRGDDGNDWGIIRVPTAEYWTDGSTFDVQAGLFGGDGNDAVYGGNGRDLVVGDRGDDLLYGGQGKDLLFGAEGKDASHGGAGADIFAFDHTIESPKGGGRDVIDDFSHSQHDMISFYFMDANVHAKGDQDFKFIGDSHFHHKAGELRFDHHIVSGDTDGDGKADFEIEVAGVNTLHADDFYL